MISLKTLGYIGALFAVVGSILPWEQEGDFVSYWTYGIQLFPVVKDNGGVLVVLLTTAIVILNFHHPESIQNPTWWSLTFSIILSATSLLFVIRWFSHFLQFSSAVGSAKPEIGLVSVVIGSVLLLRISFIRHRQNL